jgi:CRISPR associated protein
MRMTRSTTPGEPKITDTASARAAVLNGVGRGKAYGAGLLTRAPGTA